MNRREIVTIVGLSLMSPQLVYGQARKRRVGILVGTLETDDEARKRIAGFMDGMKELGWIDRQNVEYTRRFSGGRPELLPSLAAELVANKVDVIVTEGAQVTDASRNATSKIPIVMSYIGDAM